MLHLFFIWYVFFGADILLLNRPSEICPYLLVLWLIVLVQNCKPGDCARFWDSAWQFSNVRRWNYARKCKSNYFIVDCRFCRRRYLKGSSTESCLECKTEADACKWRSLRNEKLLINICHPKSRRNMWAVRAVRIGKKEEMSQMS